MSQLKVFNVILRLLSVLCLPVIYFIISGCATALVWSDHSAWKYEPSASANGKELSGESPTILKGRSNPEIRLSYSDLKKLGDGERNALSPAGCIVLKNTDDSLRLLTGLESFLRTQPSSSISSIKAVIGQRHSLHESKVYKYNFRLGLSFKDPSTEGNTYLKKTDSSWAPFLQGNHAQGEIKRYSVQDARFDKLYSPLDAFIIDSNDKGLSYFLVGGPSGGGPSGLTNLMFVDNCTTSDFTILLRRNDIPFIIQFVDVTEVKQYNHSLPARIALTPFSVAFDVVSSPIQLVLYLTADYWWPR